MSTGVDGEGQASRLEPVRTEVARELLASLGLSESGAERTIFRTLLRNPPLAERVIRLLRFMFTETRLDGRLRELIILRVAWNRDCAYIWSEHWDVTTGDPRAQRPLGGSGLGVAAADAAAVRDWERHPGFDERERAALATADEITAAGTLSAQGWDRLARAFDHDEVLEVIAVINMWTYMSVYMRALAIPMEPWIEQPWPPDGVEPRS